MKETQKENTQMSQDLDTSSKSLSYMIQKLEKISNALYILTNFFPEHEPLRTSFRERALSLISHAFSLRTYSSNQISPSINIANALDEIVSLISIAERSGLMSEANASILKEECRKVASFGQEQGLIVGPYLSEGHFAVSDESYTLPPRIELSFPTPVISQRASTSPQPQPISNSNVQTNATSPVQSAPSKESIKKEEPSGLKKRRQDAILSFIKDKGEVGIKEISREVRGCSQKTIQRELVELVDQGVINRRGERRWSLYSLGERSA